jgi:hypothetical protein
MRGFIQQDGVTTLLPPVPGGLMSTAVAVNDHNLSLVSGVLQLQPPYDSRAYVVAGNDWTQLFPLPGLHNGQPLCISDSGVIVGRSHNPANDEGHATVWLNGKPTDLNTFVDSGSSLVLEYAGGIAENGQIVVTGRFGTGGFPSVVAVLSPGFSKPGDTDCNSTVNVDDILRVINSWGPCQGCAADFGDDGIVNLTDLFVVIDNWTLAP